MKNGEIDCTAFLQWALPLMRMRWEGFRKVRKQVCKRIKHRVKELDLQSFSSYKAYLENHREEWQVLDSLCIVTISRFYRDRHAFDKLKDIILPKLAERAHEAGRSLSCWSAGCASGEEPYTLSLIWIKALASLYPDTDFHIIATDISSQMLQRARTGCYNESSLRDLPSGWKEDAFVRKSQSFCIRQDYKSSITFLHQDIREAMSDGPFDFILCRNLVWFYYEEALQKVIYRKMFDRLTNRGVMMIGGQEKLPEEVSKLYHANEKLNLYHKRDRSSA